MKSPTRAVSAKFTLKDLIDMKSQQVVETNLVDTNFIDDGLSEQ